MIKPPISRMTWADQRNAAAYHEAGHAVVAYWFGWFLRDRGVEIDDRWYTATRAHPDDFTEEAKIIQAMAGSSAEFKWHGRGRRERIGADEVEQILHLLRSGDEPDGEDPFGFGDAVTVIGVIFDDNPNLTDQQAKAEVRRWRRRTGRLLAKPVVWRCVEKVAHALIAKGRLSDEECRDVMGEDFEHVWGGAYA